MDEEGMNAGPLPTKSILAIAQGGDVHSFPLGRGPAKLLRYSRDANPSCEELSEDQIVWRQLRQAAKKKNSQTAGKTGKELRRGCGYSRAPSIVDCADPSKSEISPGSTRTLSGIRLAATHQPSAQGLTGRGVKQPTRGINGQNLP